MRIQQAVEGVMLVYEKITLSIKANNNLEMPNHDSLQDIFRLYGFMSVEDALNYIMLPEGKNITEDTWATLVDNWEAPALQ